MAINNTPFSMSPNPPNPTVGTIFFDIRSYTNKIWNGSTWLEMRSVDDTNLIYASKEALLRKKHPGLQELWEKVNEAQERYKAYLALVDNHDGGKIK